MDTPDKSERGSWITNKTFLAFFGALFALIFITLMIVINVATQVEDIDEKLKYIPPQTIAAEIPPKSVVASQMLYVPVYSHIYAKGANFIVEWVSDTKVNQPVIEAVMIGIEGQTSISFVRTGVAIDKQ